MLEIDGSEGEGGGQMLRSALALSALTRRPFRMVKIRDGRDKPGLLRQHLTAVRAAAAVCGATVDGDALRSREISFRPGPSILPGEHTFAVGSAGSVNLVLQTILWPLLAGDGPSHVVLEGGTHNPQSPPTPFLERNFFPLVARMGPQLALRLETWGFYPAGGGRLHAELTPAPLAPLRLLDRGAVVDITVEAAVSGLPAEIAVREIRTAARALGVEPDLRRVRTVDGPGPGNVMWIAVACEHVTAVFSGFGAKGIRAERVAEACAAEALAWLAAEVPVDVHLADQLVIPLALAGGAFRTQSPTLHTRTNIDVVARFVDRRVTVRADGAAWIVSAEEEPSRSP